MDIDERQLREDVNTLGHQARRAFMQGYAKTALRLRKQNLQLVDAGSPAADEACRSYLKRMTRDIDL